MRQLDSTAYLNIDEEQLYDPLTGLPSPLLQRAQLVHALRRATRNGTHVAVLHLDVDDFERLDRRLGDLADQVLVVLAARVEACLRSTDMTARLNSDRFSIVCEDVTTPRALQLLTRRISDAVSLPMHIGDHAVEVRVTVGGVLGDGSERADELLRAAHADVAERRAARAA